MDVSVGDVSNRIQHTYEVFFAVICTCYKRRKSMPRGYCPFNLDPRMRHTAELAPRAYLASLGREVERTRPTGVCQPQQDPALYPKANVGGGPLKDAAPRESHLHPIQMLSGVPLNPSARSILL